MTETHKAAVEALEELIRLQDVSLSLKIRAERINANEDEAVKVLCELYGYGAVMDSAARQWFNHPTAPKGSGHTTYHTYSVVKSVTAAAKKALRTLKQPSSVEVTDDEAEKLAKEQITFWEGVSCYESVSPDVVDVGYVLSALRAKGIRITRAAATDGVKS